VLICGECSTRNNDGESFCANCGAYLVWQGDQEKPSKNAKAGPEADPGAGKTVLMPKVPAPPDHGPASQRGTRMDQPSSVPRVTRLPGTFPEEEAAGVIRAEKPLKPAIGDSTEPPPEVKPGRRTTPLEPGPPPLKDETPPAPGELICGRCGTGNNRERHYCRRCAASLDEAAVVPPLPWWRRLASPRPKAPLPAGTRPKRKRRHFPLRLVSFLAVLGVLGGAAYVGWESVRAAVARAQDELMDGNILAQDMTASSSAPSRDPKLTIDRNTGNSWAAAVPGNTSDQYLDAWFEKPFRLSYIFISGGASDAPEAFAKERWPIKIEVVVSRPDGQSTAGPFELDDEASKQSFYVGLDVATSVRIKILESKGPEGAPVAVAEVQFLGR
jgi:hypothetical protein